MAVRGSTLPDERVPFTRLSRSAVCDTVTVLQCMANFVNLNLKGIINGQAIIHLQLQFAFLD